MNVTSDVLISDYLEYWYQTYCVPRLALNTLKGYEINIRKHILPYIGDIKLCDLTGNDLELMYSELHKKGLSPTSVIYVHAVMRKSLNTAVKRQIIQTNVTNHIEPLPRKKYRSVVINSEQMQNLINSCIGTDVLFPVLFAVCLGLRRGEVLGLKWSDIDFNRGTVSIARTLTFYKTGYVFSDVKTESSNRTLLLPSFLLEVLKNTIPVSNVHNCICVRSDGELLTTNSLQYQFKNCLKKANLPNIRFHDLRHSAATLLLRENIPAKIVSSILGHSSISITLDTYSHVMLDMQQPAIDVIDNIFKQK